MWGALREAEDVLTQAPDDNPELRLKAVHAIIQAGSSYAKLLEVGELEARLKVLEELLRGRVA
jgi:hypothetical protein